MKLQYFLTAIHVKNYILSFDVTRGFGSRISCLGRNWATKSNESGQLG